MVTGQPVWSVNSPLIQALHHYDTEVALRALEDHPAQKEETTMTATTQHRPVQLQDAVEAHARYIKELQEMVERLMVSDQARAERTSQMEERVDKQARQIAELMELADTIMSDQGDLEARLAKLEDNPKPKGQEDINDLLVSYLRDSIPGVWLTPAALAANLDLDHKSVAGRLERLSRVGGLRGQLVERKGGRGTGASPLYRVVPPPKPVQAESSDGH